MIYDKSKAPLINRIPRTKMAIQGAGFLYSLLKPFLKSNYATISRQGITYDVDLTEGIDLSLFLFGNFQDYVFKNMQFLPEDSIIFDIGANIGTMSLQFARLFRKGHVFSFEPTDYAYAKLQKNLKNNPTYAKNISLHKTFISDQTTPNAQMSAYASWKVNGEMPNEHAEVHPIHGGSIKPASETGAITLDDFCAQQDINRIDLIKIDTDGYEKQVLDGARSSIKKYLPCVIFEIGLYILEEKGIHIDYFFNYFSELGYQLINSKNDQMVTRDNFMKLIPLQYTTDLIAYHPDKHQIHSQ